MTKSFSAACRPRSAALNSKLTRQIREYALFDRIDFRIAQRTIGGSKGEPKRYATGARLKLGSTVVALDSDRLEQSASHPAEELLHLLRRRVLRQEQGENPLRRWRHRKCRKANRWTRSRVQHQLEPEERAGPGRCVSLERTGLTHQFPARITGN